MESTIQAKIGQGNNTEVFSLVLIWIVTGIIIQNELYNMV